MSTILDFQLRPESAESYSLTVCERGSAQPLASATFSQRVDFLTDFSVDGYYQQSLKIREEFEDREGQAAAHAQKR